MVSETVLIVHARSLMLESIVSLLKSSGNGRFEVVSSLANNLPDLIREVLEMKPATIVIDEATCFTEAADLMVMLLGIQRVRLIVLNSETNLMDIYDKSEFIITHPAEFFEVLNYEQAPTLLQRR